MLLLRRATASAAILAATLTMLSASPHALADDKSIAEQLFLDGKKLMEEGKAKEACPKLEESMRLGPADGTQLRLATCYEMIGRYATAWGMFREGLARAKKANNAQRIQFATEHLAAVEPKVSKVTITVEEAAKVPALEVKLDGEVLGIAGLGTALPVDPGPHKVTATAPGKMPWEGSVAITTDAQMASVRIPALEDAAAAPSPAVTTGGVPTMAYVLAGTGVVALGVTIGARVAMGSKHDDRRAECLTQTTPACDDTGKSSIQRWETISFIAGGLTVVSLGAAVYLYASAPMDSRPPEATAFVRVVPTVGGLNFEGAF
jgi:hypothetical protein